MEEIIYDYQADYNKAEGEAEKLAKEIIDKHPELEYRVNVWEGKGAFIVLYGDDDEIAMDIAEEMGDRQIELLLLGAPVYITYGGPNRKRTEGNRV